MYEVEGEGIVSERVAQGWCQRFSNGEDVKNLQLPDRPKVWNIENI